jgi:hypothetical protein
MYLGKFVEIGELGWIEVSKGCRVAPGVCLAKNRGTPKK